ncbi:tumor necrosis factor receptor superfamily member 1A isoform X2 [Syngnathoides biaculeatus]|uniref:tumor necrosis factor receptor superfamily member 1A isoform X2 n=1 Tax=Syngnathoides biaculeatus TaxID=300417 RepID=UPI002ADD8577|nr:tumor necrosis factor receptor superfamily member 1A isoform X2 [Syngnathoides biaculeatus]
MLVRSSNMDLVFLMMVSFSIQGHSTTQLPEPSIHSCNKECPPGYHKGNSDNPFLKNRCKKCGSHTFTAKCNSLEECLRCNVCGLEVQPCSFNSDVVCECKEGFYNARSQESLNCLACRDSEKSGHEQQKCEAWFKEQCLKNAECKRKCTATTAAVFVATLTTTRHSSAKQNTSSLNPNQLHAGCGQWMFIFLALILFSLLVFCICFAFYLWSFPTWRINMSDESPAEVYNEAHSRPDSSPATVTFDVFEETLMTAACQSSPTPAHLDHNDASHTCSPHKDDRVEEPSGRWPPNVLYVIINEVPLRRWKEFLRMLSVADQQVERVEFDAGLGLLEKQYQMLRLWSQRSSASLEHIFSALHSMNLSGCAQMLQESLERLQRHDQTKDEFTAC